MASDSKKRRLDPNVTQHPDMFCWGSTVHGELGLGGIEDENIRVPTEVSFAKAIQVAEISCGENYTVLMTTDGHLYSCGNNDYGQLGHLQPRKRFQQLPSLDAFIFRKISCGGYHTLAINEWGQLFTWGCNFEGQLGLNSQIPMEETPRMVRTLNASVIVQVSGGLKHALALTNNGELYSWGSNTEGQLGLGLESQAQHKPRLISSLAGVPIAFIACGGYHSVVVSKSGAIYVWGRNTFGQLGIAITGNLHYPHQLRTLRSTRIRYVSCGEDFTAFLTIDGGVFTCGAGMYGQLGHGTNSNEVLPRKIMELMGSIVTQIACGKRHMLALVPSRGRVYAWGLGGAGQLGINGARSVAIPQVVLGPWVSPNGSSIYTIDRPKSEYSVDCVVRHIYSGGDHCFASVSKREENVKPDDCRYYENFSQILIVTEARLMECQRVAMGEILDHDLITYLETVFRSQACINGSFLLDDDLHYGCSSRHSGVDVEKASRMFGMISDVQNATILELIFTSIGEGLIPSLIASPPDVETLRVYVVIPLYHGFMDVNNRAILQVPFARALQSLKPEAKRVVGIWWTHAPVQVYHRLIRAYKAIILLVLNQAQRENNSMCKDPSLKVALDALQFINELNKTQGEGLRVPYEMFYMPELSELINIRADYIKFYTGIDLYTIGIPFFNYPFLFDAQAKTILLETDQAIQMHSAMNEAASRNIFLSGAAPLSARQFLILNVSRENIVADTLRELSEHNSSDLKKPLRVKFHGEEAEDAGGVKKEFFMLLLKEILDPKYGMFKQFEETRTIWFSEDSFEGERMYFLIGVLCGLVIYNFIIINLPFPLALYKKLLGEKVMLADLKDLSPVLAKSLTSVLEYGNQDLEDIFCLNFEVTREVFGEQRVYELIPEGSKTPVTIENKKEFVELYVDYVFNKSVESQFGAFYNGFHKVCGGHVLKFFLSHELMALIVGNENYDWKELEENAGYNEGYTKNDPTIVMFWEIFHELSLEEKKKFLLFLTGSDRIPIQGMKAIKITIEPMNDDKYLPVAHTCFNLLDLPRYQTRERLRYKLLQAIQQTQGFSLV
ncbi:probable E3 ubiquitin-protein ligase HERC4 isoform X3 [Fopius arisanus]|uniref:Herc4_1 protein n=1 Tax=Fopius arisanus TaxID=64838 RepID=A0A0C9R532_9HYME|nr:PREDICTED: probable E3 ubiquitin-protein ligase HERC4 isoform X2 [Fopius arisanus]XP_011296687.1 PREDICTED: probable E3 ubiquitin-protein ligase HERC4 isoform X2 [Fopius arisanus]XP_011296688.1 PREDICTED: probable E3 ubiquitin-protein ligase HERC4 isoform X3 [Fopius arisanus]